MQKYIDLFCNRFEYKNLPEDFMKVSGKNKVFLLMLFFSPSIAFFKDEALGLQALPTTGQFEYNIAGFPTSWKVFGCGSNPFHKDLNEDNSVLMFNDYSYSIPFLQMLYNVEYMLECDSTHRQNLHAQRQPMILEIEEDEKKSASMFIDKLKTNADTIVVRKRQKGDDKKKVVESPYQSRAFESGRQFEGDKLASDYRYFDNRNLSYLGYNNENLEKKERLLVDEVNSNNEVIEGFLNSAFECQKEAFDKINKMFGTNITVELRKSNKGVEENGSEHSPLSEKPPIEKLDK